MSDQSTTTTPTTPAAPVPPAQQPDAGVVAQAAAPVTEQPQPFAVFPDAKSFNSRISRETRKQLNAQAKEAGFDDWDHMSEAVNSLRRDNTVATPTPAPTTVGHPQDAPQTTIAVPQVQTDQGEAQRLRMALTVASDLNLPTALVSRLQGETAEEMTADANRLLALFQQPVRGPGIPPAPRQNQPVTFTKAQMQDAKFVREHADELRRAMAEGRIVNS